MNKKSKSTLEKLEIKLRLKNYAEKTIEMYVYYSGQFLSSFDNDIYHISKKEAVKWLENYNYNSISQQNQIISSIKSLYKYLLNVKFKQIEIERPRKENKLPQIIDKQHILESISKIENIKHKAIISLAYSVGLRVSEVCNLKIKDIDSKRMVINIINAKCRKDRVVPLSDNILHILRKYYTEENPNEYLFNGQNKLQYTPSSCNKLIKKYIGEEYHFHQLRHACFTHLSEEGVDIHHIQKLAGHSSSKTTEIYLHLSTNSLQKLPLAI